MRSALPTLVLLIAAVTWLPGCGQDPPPETTGSSPIADHYLEKLQEAEALKDSIEQRNLEQQRIDTLLGRDQRAVPTR